MLFHKGIENTVLSKCYVSLLKSTVNNLGHVGTVSYLTRYRPSYHLRFVKKYIIQSLYVKREIFQIVVQIIHVLESAAR